MRIDVMPVIKYGWHWLVNWWLDNSTCDASTLRTAHGTYEYEESLMCTRFRWHRGEHEDRSIYPYVKWSKV